MLPGRVLVLGCQAQTMELGLGMSAAVAALLQANRTAPAAAFGVWKGKSRDGLAYQRKLRRDWDA